MKQLHIGEFLMCYYSVFKLGITAKEEKLLNYILSLHSSNKSTYASNQHILNLLGLSAKTTGRALKKFEESSWIEISNPTHRGRNIKVKNKLIEDLQKALHGQNVHDGNSHEFETEDKMSTNPRQNVPAPRQNDDVNLDILSTNLVKMSNNYISNNISNIREVDKNIIYNEIDLNSTLNKLDLNNDISPTDTEGYILNKSSLEVFKSNTEPSAEVNITSTQHPQDAKDTFDISVEENIINNKPSTNRPQDDESSIENIDFSLDNEESSTPSIEGKSITQDEKEPRQNVEVKYWDKYLYKNELILMGEIPKKENEVEHDFILRVEKIKSACSRIHDGNIKHQDIKLLLHLFFKDEFYTINAFRFPQMVKDAKNTDLAGRHWFSHEDYEWIRAIEEHIKNQAA
jgi:hypothetical protein